MKREFRLCKARLACLNGLAALVLATSTGCTGLNHWCTELRGCVSNHMVDYSNRALAERAWIKRKQRYCNFQYQQEFKDGFITGYLNVADGGDGCTPTIAPEKYWGWAYQTPHGQAAISNFFQGFPFGARAAEEDGVGYWSAIPTSGLNGLVPASSVEENSLPVPVPVIEQESAPAAQQTSATKPITSPSDQKVVNQSEELVSKGKPDAVSPPLDNFGTLPETAVEFGLNDDKVSPTTPSVTATTSEAGTDTSSSELTFTFE